MADVVKMTSPQGTKVTVSSELADKLKTRGWRAPAGRPPKAEKK